MKLKYVTKYITVKIDVKQPMRFIKNYKWWIEITDCRYTTGACVDWKYSQIMDHKTKAASRTVSFLEDKILYSH